MKTSLDEPKKGRLTIGTGSKLSDSSKSSKTDASSIERSMVLDRMTGTRRRDDVALLMSNLELQESVSGSGVTQTVMSFKRS
jgi:hypothetical protein